MRARFIGDPLNGGDGPSVMHAYGFEFPKGEWVEVGEPPAKMRGSNHYEIEGDPLDHDGDGRKGGSTAPDDDDVPALRAAYTEAFGKKPFAGWGADTLRSKLAEAA